MTDLVQLVIKEREKVCGFGFFLYKVLDLFIPICEKREDFERATKYKNIMLRLKKALNTSGWDGRWFKRAFMDDGNVLR